VDAVSRAQVQLWNGVWWAAVGVLLAAGVLLPGPSAAWAGERGPRGWPLDGSPAVSRDFAPPEIRFAAGHRGVDLPSAPGAPVLAAAGGRVAYAGLLAGRGVVVVSHGELRTTYEPVTAVVHVGSVVEVGAVLGRLEAGHVGCPVSACLHWGLKRGPDYLDPVRWVAGGPVRLLPVEGALDARGSGIWIGPQSAGGAQRGGPVPATVPADRSAGRGTAGALSAGERAGGGSEPAGDAGVAPAAPDRAQAEPVLPAHSEGEPSWSLRSAEAPLGAAAVVALVAGIGLLTRPRPPSPEPVSGGAATPVPGPDEEEEVRPPGELLDLDAARARRQAG